MAKPFIFQKMVQVKYGESKTANTVPVFADTSGTLLKGTDIELDTLSSIYDKTDEILTHIDNEDIHVTKDEKDHWDTTTDDMQTHINDNNIHITEQDRTNWDSKETEEGAQTKANIVQSNLNLHINNSNVHCTEKDKTNWNDKYTKSEIDNKFSMLEFNNDWKEAVQTFDDLFITYPDPYEGWTVNVLDSGITYRFNGEEWVGISANATPLVTHEIDGLMRKEDKIKLDNIEEGANAYEPPDGCLYVTQEQVNYWSNKADKTLVTYEYDGLMGKEDKYKLDGIEEGATNYVEPDTFPPQKIEEDENHRWVTDEEKTYWSNKANNNLATINLDGLMSKSDKKKLDSVEFNANYYVHPVSHPPRIIEQDENNRFVTDVQINYWDSKADANFANEENGGLMTAEDKHKLDTIEYNANNYIHPDKHKPDIIEQDKDNRFVSDLEKATWNGMKSIDDFQCGDAIFNSSTGVEIPHKFGDTTFTVSITPTELPVNVGDVWVKKDNEKIIVYCVGSATDIPFDYTLIHYKK